MFSVKVQDCSWKEGNLYIIDRQVQHVHSIAISMHHHQINARVGLHYQVLLSLIILYCLATIEHMSCIHCTIAHYNSSKSRCINLMGIQLASCHESLSVDNWLHIIAIICAHCGSLSSVYSMGYNYAPCLACTITHYVAT